MEPEKYIESRVIELKEMWKEISKEKIQEAYEEYMLRNKLKKNSLLTLRESELLEQVIVSHEL